MSVETKLAALGVINVSLYTVLNAMYVLWYIGYNNVWQYHILDIFADLLCLNNPYLLLLFSGQLRGYFVQMITCGYKKPSGIAVRMFHFTVCADFELLEAFYFFSSSLFRLFLSCSLAHFHLIFSLLLLT